MIQLSISESNRESEEFLGGSRPRRALPRGIKAFDNSCRSACMRIDRVPEKCGFLDAVHDDHEAPSPNQAFSSLPPSSSGLSSRGPKRRSRSLAVRNASGFPFTPAVTPRHGGVPPVLAPAARQEWQAARRDRQPRPFPPGSSPSGRAPARSVRGQPPGSTRIPRSPARGRAAPSAMRGSRAGRREGGQGRRCRIDSSR